VGNVRRRGENEDFLTQKNAVLRRFEIFGVRRLNCRAKDLPFFANRHKKTTEPASRDPAEAKKWIFS